MTEATFDTFPVHELRRLVTEEWPSLRDDRQRMKARLRDEFPEYELQVHALAVGLDVGAFSALSAPPAVQPLPLEAARLSQLLTTRYGLQERVARWSVAAWGFALGRWPESAVSSAISSESAAQWLAELEQPEGRESAVKSFAATEPDAPEAAVTRAGSTEGDQPDWGSSRHATVEESEAPASRAVIPPPIPPKAVEPPVEKSGPAEDAVAPRVVAPAKASRLGLILGLVIAGLVVVVVAIVVAVKLLHHSPAALKPLWNISPGAVNSAPAVEQGEAIVGTGSNIKAYSLSTGKFQWSQSDPAGDNAYIDGGGGALFATDTKEIYSLDPRDGDILWTFQSGAHGLTSVDPGPPSFGGGLVFAPGNSNARLYAVKSTTGAYVNYIYNNHHKSLFYAPAIDSQDVFIPYSYFGSTPDEQYVDAWAINTFATATKDLWRTAVGPDSTFQPPMASSGPGTIFAVNPSTSSVYRLDPGNKGAQLWKKQIGSGLTNVAPAGSIVAVADGTTVFGLSISSGGVVWRFHTLGSIQAAPTYYQGAFYVGDTAGRLYAIKAASGRKIWTFRVGGPIDDSPAAGDGTVVVASKDGGLHAFKAAGLS